MKTKILLISLLFFAHARATNWFNFSVNNWFPTKHNIYAFLGFKTKNTQISPSGDFNALVRSASQNNQNSDSLIMPGEATPPPAMVNQGNGCYGISPISALLFGSPKIRTYFLEAQGALEKSKDPVHQEIAQLLKQGISGTLLNPTNLVNKVTPETGIRRQGDTAEFIQQLIAALKTLPTPENSEGYPVTEAFNFTIQEDTHCSHCNKHKLDYKEIRDSINASCTEKLEDVFVGMQQPDDHWVECDSGKHIPVQKTRTIKTMPDVLVVNLQRNDCSGARNETATAFPLTDFEPVKGKGKYDWQGMILHGGGDTSGHYVSIAPSDDNKIYLRNDATRPVIISADTMKKIAQNGHLKGLDDLKNYKYFLPTSFIYAKQDPVIIVFDKIKPKFQVPTNRQKLLARQYKDRFVGIFSDNTIDNMD